MYSIVVSIIWALGSIPNNKDIYIKKLGTSYSLSNLQKAAILGSTNLLRKGQSVKWKIKWENSNIQKFKKKWGLGVGGRVREFRKWIKYGGKRRGRGRINAFKNTKKMWGGSWSVDF